MTLLEEALAEVRERDRSLRFKFADDAEADATVVETHFGAMLNAFAEVAAAGESDKLLRLVDECKADIFKLVSDLRTNAAAARY
jgi:hypothetical protein